MNVINQSSSTYAQSPPPTLPYIPPPPRANPFPGTASFPPPTHEPSPSHPFPSFPPPLPIGSPPCTPSLSFLPLLTPASPSRRPELANKTAIKHSFKRYVTLIKGRNDVTAFSCVWRDAGDARRIVRRGEEKTEKGEREQGKGKTRVCALGCVCRVYVSVCK